MSKRLNVLTAIKDKLETLSGFDVVLYGQTVDFEYDKAAIAFQPISHEYQENNLIQENEVEIQITAIKFNVDFMTDGEALLSDLENLIVGEHWNKNANKTVLIRNDISFDEKGKKALLIEFVFKVKYLF
jgi:hypothetical protein